MKLTCNGIDLADAFNKVSKALTGKSAIPILDGVKISAYGDKLTLVASDSEITIENSIKANIMLEGEVVVPGRLTAELIRKMSSEQIELEALGNNLINIKYLDSCSKINLLNVEEYPMIKYNNFDNSFVILQGDLKDLITKTHFSAAVDNNREILKGCKVEVEGDSIKFVAIDGLRLAIAKKVLNKVYKNINFIVKVKFLTEIAKLIENEDKIVKISSDNSKVVFDMEYTKIIVSMLEGEFIDYRRILPQTDNTRVIIHKNQLSECLDRTNIFSRVSGANMVKLEIAENILTMYSKSEIGDITEKMNVSVTGKDNKIALNSKFISDCLRAIGDEYIALHITTSVVPCVIQPLEGDGYLYMILPVRVMS